MQSTGDVEAFEQQLRRSLYRFDCPSSSTLGEYGLDLLDATQRQQVAAHAVDCDECRTELQTLRAFLAEEVQVPEPALARARRVIATLFTPGASLAVSGLRGAADASARIFEAGEITLSVSAGQTPGSLIGLVVAVEPLTDREVRLLPREGAALVTHVDDVGNFVIEGAPPGPYALEIDLPDGVLVIEELNVQ